ncbi:hypothetical protein N7540_012983 [Penicillium herquei]|nr:hypothetical protein N7540_012983 [Penicillium herquei]
MQLSVSVTLASMEPISQPPSDITCLAREHRALAILRYRVSLTERLHYLDDIITVLTRFRLEYSTRTPDQIFESVQLLQNWLFWLLPSILWKHRHDPVILAIIAQFCAVAIAIYPFYPDCLSSGDAYLCSLSLGPIERLSRILALRRSSDPMVPGHPLAMLLMELPRQIVADYHRLSFPTPPLIVYSSTAPIEQLSLGELNQDHS